ncbi:MAG: hypothetical protein ABI047_03160 [Jatrophihabitantaceae bacterium]
MGRGIANQLARGDDWVVRELRNLKEKIRRLESGRSILNNASINKGGIQIVKGGSLRVIDVEGVETARIGALPSPALDKADGTPQPGVLLRREDGSTALFLGDLTPTVAPFKQSLQLFDRLGNVIFADDTDGGVGLARPYVPAGVFADITAPSATTNSASFVGLQWADSYMQHPKVTCSMLVQTSAGTASQVRLTVGGVQIGVPLAIAAASFGQFTIPPSTWPAGSYVHEGRVTVQLEARVTSGTGTVGVRALGFWGVQT